MEITRITHKIENASSIVFQHWPKDQIINAIEASCDPESIRTYQASDLTVKADGSVIIEWRPRKWILTDLELQRKYGLSMVSPVKSKLSKT